MSDLKTLFRPRSIAVIGASIHSDRAGHIVMALISISASF